MKNNKQIVIAGSSNLQDEISRWIEYWNEQDGYSVVNWPKPVNPENFDSEYPEVHKNFLKNIMEADMLFIANEDKNNTAGYIGAETFAEMAFAVAQNLINNKNTRIVLAKMPSKNVQSFDEIVLWRRLGWIEIKNEKDNQKN